jgi:hypothetical protein
MTCFDDPDFEGDAPMEIQEWVAAQDYEELQRKLESALPGIVYVLFEEVSDQHGASKPIGVFLHELTEQEQRQQSPNRITYLKKFEVQP